MSARALRNRPYRQTAPVPLAVLALTTLATCWCLDKRHRVHVAVLFFVLTVAPPFLPEPSAWAAPTGLPAIVAALPRPEELRLRTWSLPSIPAWLTGSSTIASTESHSGTTIVQPSRQSEASAVQLAPEPAPLQVQGAAAPATRQPWRASELATAPYPERVERWRSVVRELMAEAWDEGRLDGPAARLDDDLVLALIRQESAGDPTALSWAKAIGLMQVMPFTFAEMLHGDRALTCAIDPAAMWDVRSNVRAGLRYLALAMQAHEGNVYWALASYNAGIDAARDWRAAGLYAVPPIGGYTETANYTQVILRDYLRRRPDVTMHVPDPMPASHVPGAVFLLRGLEARNGARAPEWYPRCGA